MYLENTVYNIHRNTCLCPKSTEEADALGTHTHKKGKIDNLRFYMILVHTYSTVIMNNLGLDRNAKVRDCKVLKLILLPALSFFIFCNVLIIY